MINTLIGLLLALSLIAILAYDRIRYGKPVSQGSSKANTVHAIELANSAEYQRMVTTARLYDAVIADILESTTN